jgi:uncharacterized radical SAM superfamily Fe-S cluster-containing enzyme
MRKTIRNTRSVCPVCLQNLPAQLVRQENGEIMLEKDCPDHGAWSVPVWRGKVDFDLWAQYAEPLAGEEGTQCPGNCGI